MAIDLKKVSELETHPNVTEETLTVVWDEDADRLRKIPVGDLPGGGGGDGDYVTDIGPLMDSPYRLVGVGVVTPEREEASIALGAIDPNEDDPLRGPAMTVGATSFGSGGDDPMEDSSGALLVVAGPDAYTHIMAIGAEGKRSLEVDGLHTGSIYLGLEDLEATGEPGQEDAFAITIGGLGAVIGDNRRNKEITLTVDPTYGSIDIDAVAGSGAPWSGQLPTSDPFGNTYGGITTTLGKGREHGAWYEGVVTTTPMAFAAGLRLGDAGGATPGESFREGTVGLRYGADQQKFFLRALGIVGVHGGPTTYINKEIRVLTLEDLPVVPPEESWAGASELLLTELTYEAHHNKVIMLGGTARSIDLAGIFPTGAPGKLFRCTVISTTMLKYTFTYSGEHNVQFAVPGVDSVVGGSTKVEILAGATFARIFGCNASS